MGKAARYSPYQVTIALMFAAVLAAAAFFQGFYTEFLGLTLSLLCGWFLLGVLRGHASGFEIPRTATIGLLLAYWAWLAISVTWSQVTFTSAITFWWLGALPLACLSYLMTDRKGLWPALFAIMVCAALGLAVTAIVQAFVLDAEPTATFLYKQSLAALLNLVALPLCAYFLIGFDKRRALGIVCGVALFVLYFGIAVIKGRGAMLSGVLALGLLAWMAAGRVPRRRLTVLLGIVVGAFVAANVMGDLGLGARVATMLDPWNAGATRWVIWAQAWDMLKTAPILGIGLGHFALVGPAYRRYDDQSAGFFVHNDYLQIWLEAGLPAVLLLLALFVAVAWLYVRVARTRAVPNARKLEITGLFCGLFAIAAHSFVDFNLYILSTSIIAGTLLGRLHELAAPALKLRPIKFTPAKWFGRPAWSVMAVLLISFPLLYFLTLGLASYEYRRGLDAAAEGRLQETYESFERAMRLVPGADNVVMSQADLVRHFIDALPPGDAQRASLYAETERLLDRAEALNPYRPQTFAVRAMLYQDNQALAGPQWKEKAGEAYRRAIAINPRGYPVRVSYAKLLLASGKRDEARRVLEEGMPYWYLQVSPIVPYYMLTARLRLDAGDREGAHALALQIEAALHATERNWKPLPERALETSGAVSR